MTLQIFDQILTDRGSKYAVSGAPADSVEAAQAFVKQLRKSKKFAKATHHSWAIILQDEAGKRTAIKQDDGESGAGMVILRMLERADCLNHLVIVTRWFGGTKLGGDRFRRIQDCVRAYFDKTAY